MGDRKDTDLAWHIKRVEASPTDTNLRRLLKYIKEHSVRRPDLVVEHGAALVAKTTNEGEAWEIREQIFLAALDLHDMKTARDLLEKFGHHFTSSNRVERLRGQFAETEGRFDDARAIYRGVLEREPSDHLSRKRLICILKGEGDVATAIAELNRYISVFQADVDAWKELAQLYLSKQDYEYAAFCYEELLLAEPLNFHFHTRYAEILYTLRQYETARTYFAHSLELEKEKNTRALFGLAMACQALASQKGSLRRKGSSNADVSDWAAEQLRARYASHESKPLGAVVMAFVDQLTT